jgi:type I restriction enzyme M protein
MNTIRYSAQPGDPGDRTSCRSLESIPSAPSSAFAADCPHRDGSLIWLPLRGKWADVTHQPEELVRQTWFHRLHVEGGYALSQMAQERRNMSGRKSPRADIVVWASAGELAKGATPALVVETKAGTGPFRMTCV